jgi:DNA polymerase I-like protein with 3'-5' exonuclease and polymerase domains
MVSSGTPVREIVFDIETDGLDPDVVHCVCALEGEVAFWTKDASEFQAYITQGHCRLVGHNIIAYDIPVLEKLWNIDFSGCEIVDTLVLSRLANPSREGGHSLKAWGERLNLPKGDHSDWDTFSPEMLLYCQQDVVVTKRLLQEARYELSSNPALKLKGFSQESIDLEHDVQRIISKQIDKGWLLDQEKAFVLLAQLKEQKNEYEEEVHKTFKPLPTFVKEIQPRVKKDNTLSVVGLKFLGDQWTDVCGDFSRIDWEQFNLGSRQQIGRYLQYFGWVPEKDKYTETGKPIVDEKTLSEVTDIPEAVLISKYLTIQKRIAQVQSWIDAVKDDGRVHGYVNSIGAVTSRMTHSSPNMGQVPASYSPYGRECRECWVVPKGYSLVGMDASGLELRMLAHYMNDEDYTNEILNGDIHTTNQIHAGIATRDQAKTFIYAFLYGAGDAKIGSIVGGDAEAGRYLKEEFLRNTPALARLRERVGRSAARGYVRGLDGRRVIVRSEHSALNTLLQSAGAIVMKKALCLLDYQATAHKLDYHFIGNIHDEIQSEVRQEMAEQFGLLSTTCMESAGTHFNLRCSLSGEFKVGSNWKDTH